MAGEISNFYVTLGLRAQQFTRGIDEAKQKLQSFASTSRTAVAPSAEIFANLGQRVIETENRFASLKQALQGAATQMAVFGGAIVASLGAMLVKTAQVADRVDDLSKRTGVSARDLSRLGYVAEQSGSSMEALAHSTRFLYNNIYQAGAGVKSAQSLFEKLGVSIRDAEGNLKNASQILPEIAEQFQKIQDPAERSYLAVQLFGRSGQELIPVLDLGRAGIERLAEEADRLGITMDNVRAREMGDFNDALTALKRSFEALIRDAMYPLIQALRPTVDRMVQMVSGLREWANAHQELVAGLTKLVGAGGLLLVLVGALNKIYPLIQQITGAWRAFATALGMTAPELTGITVGVIALINAFSAMKQYFDAPKKQVQELTKSYEEWKKTIETMSVDDAVVNLEELRNRLHLLQVEIQGMTERAGLGVAPTEKELSFWDRLFNANKRNIAMLQEQAEWYQKIIGLLEKRVQAEQKVAEAQRAGADVQQITEWLNTMVEYERMSNEQRRDLLKQLLMDEKLTAEQRADVEKQLQQANLEIFRDASQNKKKALQEIQDVEAKMAQEEQEVLQKRRQAFEEYAQKVIDLANRMRGQYGLTLQVPRVTEFKNAMELVNRLMEEQKQVAEMAGRAVGQTLTEAYKQASQERLDIENRFIDEYLAIQNDFLSKLKDIAERRKELERGFQSQMENNRETLIRSLDAFYDFRDLVKMTDDQLMKLAKTVATVKPGKVPPLQEEGEEERKFREQFYAQKDVAQAYKDRIKLEEDYQNRKKELDKEEEEALKKRDEAMKNLANNLKVSMQEILDAMNTFKAEYLKSLGELEAGHTQAMNELTTKLNDAKMSFVNATTDMANAVMSIGEYLKPPDLTGWEDFAQRLSKIDIQVNTRPLAELRQHLQNLAPANGFSVPIAIPEIDKRIDAVNQLKEALNNLPSEKLIKVTIQQEVIGGGKVTNSNLKKMVDDADKKGQFVGVD